ncbi:hypothetical protein GUJ93_ZPchr0008g13789 [Zizania palustris]|uniref:Uncharacterized protein n=1 Tax=Zizania palustris TaxID=103762 RepID=A0A8J5QXX6_ZIZPA|nr:hypothetical protein GUJ93_ZPchr0008g13789 [Zizania palustris]
MRPVANMALIQIARDRSQVSSIKHVVLELQEDGKLTTSESLMILQLCLVAWTANSFRSMLLEMSPLTLRIEDLVASIQLNNMEVESTDAEMQG